MLRISRSMRKRLDSTLSLELSGTMLLTIYARQAEEAVETSKRLTSNVENLQRRVDAMDALWAPLSMTGDFERLGAMTQQLVETARALDDSARLGRALLKLGGCRYIEARYDDLHECAREAVERGGSEDPMLRLQAPVGLGMAHECRGDYRSAIRHFKQITDGPEVELAKRRFSLHAPPYISAISRLAFAYAQLGLFDEAMAHAVRATEAAAELASPVSLAVAHLFKAMALASRGDFEGALTEAGVAVRQCEMHGVVAWLPAAYALCGFARAHAAPSKEALAQVERGAGAHAAIGLKTYLSWITRLWARVLFLSGADGEASDKAEEALVLARQFGERGEEVEISLLLADIALNRQDLASGTTLYRQAFELGEKLGMRPAIARCHLGLGRVSSLRGVKTGAKQHMTTAMAMFGEMGMTYWLEKAEAELRNLE
jgi:tetratricopeptide (TPR) repeat protein